MHRFPQSKERGFTILLAALVTSLVLTLGISIFSVAQKQVLLSSLGRNSQYAFYAADSGAECALYWDVRHEFFSSTSPAGIVPACGGDGEGGRPQLDLDPPAVPLPGTQQYTMTFEFEPNGYCAIVSVTKNAPGLTKTIIHSDGFSTPCLDIETSNRALQRSVEIRY